MRKIKCDYHYVDNLVARYEEEGGYAIQLNEGSLASGDWILYDDTGKLKCFYIYEEALNSWSSCQIVQVYMDWNGFPYHALDTYLPKLIRAGQRVAICDYTDLQEVISPAR